jgi:hypothetical protein
MDKPKNYWPGTNCLLQFDPDGYFYYGNTFDDENQRVIETAWGEWWIEEEILHIMDISTGTGWGCKEGAEAFYQVFNVGDGNILFTSIEEPCTKDTFFPSRWMHLDDRVYLLGVPEE